MNRVMRPLGSILTTLPVEPERPGVLAGPAFEIVQPSSHVLPHRQAAWRILAERLQQLADRGDRLGATAGLAQLAELANDLHGMARDIESAQSAGPCVEGCHDPDRGRQRPDRGRRGRRHPQ
jgi:hypothetical protein